ncbi:hypothetical protein RV07_GL000796 [Enterococcus malodoratus]|nr:hypothetical protein RV07_GL000796 [Enterococcus malodoratus]
MDAFFFFGSILVLTTCLSVLSISSTTLPPQVVATASAIP